MALLPSSHVDTFTRDNLPPEDQWPEILLDGPDVTYPDRLNCGVELVDKIALRLGGDRPCLLAPGAETWTYERLSRTSDQIAQALMHAYDILPGNRVLLRGPNNPWLVACWIGVMKAGAVAVPTMPMLRAGEVAVVADIAEVNFALCDSRFAAELEGVTRLQVVTFGETSELSRVLNEVSPDFEPVLTSADDVALLAFTSGTTGRPKATMHFHRDLLAIADTFSAQVVKPRPDDVFTGTPPLAFTFGLGGLVVFPLRVGAASLLIERATPDELADMIAEHQVTICFTAPTAYKAMVSSGAVDRLASLRRAVSAGEHLPEVTWSAVKAATGLELINGIGATEMLHVFISAADEAIRPGATGLVVPGYQACVVGDDFLPVTDGTPGRLAVKGPTACRYLADDRQRAYVQNGWNITGDAFLRDEDGYFWYQGRLDDMIVSSGYNIAGPEVEEALLAHPAVLECGVVGLPDESRGQLVSAFVVLAPDQARDDAMVRELQDFVKQQIAPYKYPRSITFVSQLPKTATNKVQRFLLRSGHYQSV